MSTKPDITLYFLNSSRAVRIAWLLEELNLPYHLVASDRAPNGLAPPEFREKIPARLRKSPTIKDGDLVLQETTAIAEYLCEAYDPSHRLIGSSINTRAQVREWMAASEGTFLMHGIAILYARARLPKSYSDAWPEMNRALSPNASLSSPASHDRAHMHNDLDWLDGHLAPIHANGGKYLVGNNLTAADITMLYSIQLIYDRSLGLEGTERKWEHVERWRADMESEPSWKKCVERTGFVLGQTL